MSRLVIRYAVVTVGLILLCAGLLTLVFKGPGDAQAVWISAGVAIGVQVLAIGLARIAGGTGSITARMGAGALVRFLAVVVYAFLVAMVIHLPLTAALISLATFFFLSTVLEPVLIRS